LLRQRKHEEALAALVALAEGDVTDLQKSGALEQAAGCARSLRDFRRASELADRIPIEAVAKTAQMHNLLAQRKAPELIAQFGAEDVGAWPFWEAGDGYFARGRAYAVTGAGKEAEVDLTRALEWTSDPRIRQSILFALGDNRERHLKDDDAAFEAYRQIVEPRRSFGAANEFSALQGMARILTRRGKFDEALATLHLADIDKLQGHWRGSMLLALGETLAAAGQKDKALVTYRALLGDDSVEPSHQRAAEEAIETLESQR
jgi:tetratricopeptide (TPR) repeat protein